MRFSLLSLLILLQSTFVLAQIEFSPLTSNPVVKEAYQEKMARWEATESIASQSRAADCDVVDQELYGKSDSSKDVYVTSGATKKFCINQLSFDLLDSIYFLDEMQLNFGTAIIDAEDFCVFYTADAGIDLNFMDTIKIVAIEQSGNDTSAFPMIIRRASNSIVAPVNVLTTSDQIEICLPQLNLPGTEFSYSSQDCGNPLIGKEGMADSCFNYRAFRFAETDTLCFEVCDEYCVCDEILIPIQIEADTILTLPFFDDFSSPGPFPDPIRWLDDRVFVNNTLSYLPPSIGVATFDGIGDNGTPYGGGYGPSDFLTSNYIDLSGFNAFDNINLSFYLAPKGKGYAPAFADSVILEFRRQDGEWEEVATFAGLEQDTALFDPITFDSFYVLPVTDIDFLHDAFQFRFYNNCQRIGVQYLWHLDYVRLENAVIDSVGSLKDLAIIEEPNSALKNFNHMPFDQFIENAANELDGNHTISIFNHWDVQTIADSGVFKVTDLVSGNIVFPIVGLINEADRYPANARKDSSFTKDYAGIIPNNIPAGSSNLILETNFTIPSTIEIPATHPATITNNEATRLNYIDDFYGYDDGSAEIVANTKEEGQALAIEFDLNVADSINGFQIYFPHFGGGQAAGDEFIIRIHEGSLDTEPIYASKDYEVLFPDAITPGIAQFTKYRLLDDDGNPTAVPVKEGKFFMVIEQANDNDRIVVGYDLNSARFNQKNWFFILNSETWVINNGPGTYMIRPVLGKGLADATNTEEISEVLNFEVYPNPANSEINVKTPIGNYNYSLFDIYGRVVKTGNLEPIISVQELNSGLYYLHVEDLHKGNSGVQKIQILR